MSAFISSFVRRPRTLFLIQHVKPYRLPPAMEVKVAEQLVDGDDGWISDESSFYGTAFVSQPLLIYLWLTELPHRRRRAPQPARKPSFGLRPGKLLVRKPALPLLHRSSQRRRRGESQSCGQIAKCQSLQPIRRQGLRSPTQRDNRRVPTTAPAPHDAGHG